MVPLAIILIILWILGGLVFKVAGAAIHLLVIVAVVMLIMRAVRGRKAPV